MNTPTLAGPPSAGPGQAAFEHFGTTAHLLVTDPARLSTALRLLHTDLAAIDAACSRFRPDSELSRANATAGADGPALEVGPLLAEALDVAWQAAAESGGLVDPTVGASMIRLGYDRTFASLRPEQLGDHAFATPLPAPGYRAVGWDSAGRRLRLPADAALDLGATAKAWAADRSARRIAEAVGCGVLVNLGGDLAVAGAAPEGGWRVGVADDHRAPRPDSPVVAVHEGALATSGTAVRAWRRAGQRLHHVVDPRTGANPVSCWRTVTVAAGSCVAANTAATAALVLGPEAPAMLRDTGLPARLVHEDGHVVRVCDWPEDTPALAMNEDRGAA